MAWDAHFSPQKQRHWHELDALEAKPRTIASSFL